MFSKAQLTPCMALRESRHSGRHVKPHQNPVFEILQVYTSHFPFVQVSAEPLAAGSSFKHRAQYLSSTSFSWSTVYVCLFLSRGTDLAPFRSLKCRKIPKFKTPAAYYVFDLNNVPSEKTFTQVLDVSQTALQTSCV